MDERDELIPGVYNYCDRWCERCPLAARCMVYGLQSGRIAERLSVVAVASPAEPEGPQFEVEEVDLSPPELSRMSKALRHKAREARRDPLCVQAEGYSHLVYEWLEKAGHPEASPRDVPPPPLEVVAHFYLHIAAKIYRAVSGTLDEDYEPGNLQDDVHGSAKAALLAIRRSEVAWMEVRPPNASGARKALALLEVLGELRRALEARFPRAYEFVRPGFDQPRDAGRMH